MTLERKETKEVHVRINYMHIMFVSAEINNHHNNPVSLMTINNLYLDLLKIVLGILQTMTHLTIKKTLEEGIIKIHI
jgi:hypothetical protein